MLASLEDMRQENRRLVEKEKQLQANLDQSEEQLRALQTENSSLLSQLQRSVHFAAVSYLLSELCVWLCSMQQDLVKVEVVERENSAIAQSCKSVVINYSQLVQLFAPAVKEEEGKCQLLQETAEKMVSPLSVNPILHSFVQRLELTEAQKQVERLKESVTEGEGQREHELQETVDLQQRLTDREVCQSYAVW